MPPTDFSADATTANSYIAVASNKDDIRMFDCLGIVAKTNNGRWVLATICTYLLLIDALQKTGSTAGKLGFEKAFTNDDKQQPRQLGLSPSPAAQFMHETKSCIAFMPARFATGDDAKRDHVTKIGLH